MCGRYWLADEISTDELRSMIEEIQSKRNDDFPLKTYGEVFPSDVVPIRVQANPVREEVTSVAAKWGFGLSGTSKLVINAKSETFNEKLLFRKAMRCLVPATNYFEWETIAKEEADQRMAPQQMGFADLAVPVAPAPVKKKMVKEKRAIKPKRTIGLFYMAGLMRYEAGSDIPVFTILTREAAPSVRHVHPRMPVILCEEERSAWLLRGELSQTEGEYIVTKITP